MSNLSGVTALVLAGGLGTRLRPVLSDRPKALAPVAGRAFIFFLLDRLASIGIRKTVLCTGYLAPMIRHAVGDEHHGMQIEYSVEELALGTGGALRRALTFVDTELVLVLNGDSYCKVSIAEYFQWYCNHPGRASLLLVPSPAESRYGNVKTEKERVIGFQEKGDAQDWINAGIYFFPRVLLNSLPQGISSLETDLFPLLINKGLLIAYQTTEAFIDIGTDTSLRKAQDFFS